MLAPDSTFTGAEGLEISKVPDGYVIYLSESERVHFLNETAVIVYELCVGGRSVAQIAEFLTDAYALQEPPARSVRDCIALLLTEGLIELCPSSSVP